MLAGSSANSGVVTRGLSVARIRVSVCIQREARRLCLLHGPRGDHQVTDHEDAGWRGLGPIRALLGRHATERRGVERMTRVGRAVVVALVAGVALAACGSGASTATSGTLPPVQVQGSTPGSSSVGAGPGGPGISSGSLPGLPSNFPKGVPLPHSYVLVSSLASNQKTSAGWHLSLALPGTISSAFASWKSQLAAAGYSVAITSSSATSETLKASNSTWTVTAVGPEPAAVMTVGIPPGSVVAGVTIS